jgi:hypothetical protein
MVMPTPPKKNGEREPGISQNVAVVKPSSVTTPFHDRIDKLKDRQYKRCPYGCGLVREEKFAKHISHMHSADSPLLKKQRKVEVPSPKSTDAVWRSVSAGRPESNRRKH